MLAPASLTATMTGALLIPSSRTTSRVSDSVSRPPVPLPTAIALG